MEVAKKAKKRRPFTPTVKIAVGYLILIAFGAAILLLPFATWENKSIGFTTALFTSTSAVCVTGLTVVDIFTTFSWFGQAIIFLLIQMGGLGFMTMAALILLLLGKKLSLKDKFSIAESLNTNDLSQIARFVKTVGITALVIELLGAIAVFPVFNTMEGGTGLAIWRSIFHSVAAFCNAGFDLMGGTGMTPFLTNPLFNIVTITLIFCGGMGCATIMNVRSRVLKKERITFNTKVIVGSSIIALVVGAGYIFVAEFNNPATMADLTVGQKIMASFFQSMTSRSAGFNTIDQGALSTGTYLMTTLLMVVGVAPASTGGGIKLATLVVLLASMKACASGGGDYSLGKRSISVRTFNKAICILVFYIIALCASLLLLSISDGEFGLHALIFECVSALSNVGVTTGITSSVSVFGRFVLICLMYLGRAGFLCVVYSLANSNKPNIKYPDSKLIIG